MSRVIIYSYYILYTVILFFTIEYLLFTKLLKVDKVLCYVRGIIRLDRERRKEFLCEKKIVGKNIRNGRAKSRVLIRVLGFLFVFIHLFIFLPYKCAFVRFLLAVKAVSHTNTSTRTHTTPKIIIIIICNSRTY